MSTRADREFRQVLGELSDLADNVSAKTRLELLDEVTRDIAELQAELRDAHGDDQRKLERWLRELHLYREFLGMLLQVEPQTPRRRRGPKGIRDLITATMRSTSRTLWTPRLVHEALLDGAARGGSAPSLNTVQLAMRRMAETDELTRVSHGVYQLPTPKGGRKVVP